MDKPKNLLTDNFVTNEATINRLVYVTTNKQLSGRFIYKVIQDGDDGPISLT